MSLESDVFGVMSAHAPLTALLGGAPPAFRMFPSVIAQGVAFPAGAYAIRSEAIATLGGLVVATQARVTVQCWAEGIATAKQLADAVVGAFAAASVPVATRDGSFDADIGLHVESVEFDWWST